MKKLLLLAAVAGMTLAANAQDYTFTQLWKSTDVPASADNRQGFGMNGKFYINDKANKKVVVYGENGLTNEEFNGSANCGINRDQAGNIVLLAGTFPGAWGSGVEFKVINPETGDEISLEVPDDILPAARIDFLGVAQVTLFEDGAIYYTCAGAGNIYRLGVTGGETDYDYSYAIPVDLSADNMTTVHAYGEDQLFYNYRSAWFIFLNLVDESIEVDKTVSTQQEVAPMKNSSNGAFAFNFDGKDFIVFPTADTKTNYRDGMAVVAADDPNTVLLATDVLATGNPNTFQSNWCNAEVVDENTVLIYHYVPGMFMEVYKMEKAAAEVLPASISLNIEDGQEISLKPGETFQLEVTVLPADATNKAVTFSSSDESVVSVDENGLVKALDADKVAELKRRAAEEGDQVKSVTVTVTSDADPTVKAEAIFNVDYTATGVEDINSAKTVSSVRYFNAAGLEAAQAFDGVNVVITKYTDGTQSVAKVVK